MTGEMLYSALELLDDRYLEEAICPKKPHPAAWLAPIAACALLAVLLWPHSVPQVGSPNDFPLGDPVVGDPIIAPGSNAGAPSVDPADQVVFNAVPQQSAIMPDMDVVWTPVTDENHFLVFTGLDYDRFTSRPSVEWVLTAAHTVDTPDGEGGYSPHDYRFVYEQGESCIILSVSSLEEPLRDLLILCDDPALSRVCGVEMVVQGDESAAMTQFEHNGLFYDVETRRVTAGDLRAFLADVLAPQAGVPVSLEGIVVNELENTVDGAPLWYDPALYDRQVWDRAAMVDYFDADLTPPWLPKDWVCQRGGSYVSEKGGAIVHDTLWMGCSLPDAGYEEAGLDLTASKLGQLGDCIYLLPENEVVSSDIAGTPVTFGYRAMPYGPYAPETKEPAGHYDLYVAEFTLGDMQIQLVARRMALEDVVRVTAGIITGNAEVLVA